MTQADFFALLIYCSLAFAIALLLVLVQGIFLSMESRFSRWTLPAVPLLMCVGLAVSTALSGRNLKFAAQDIRTIAGPEGGGGGSLMRAISAVILAICFAKIVHELMRLRSKDQILGGRPLLIGFLGLAFATHGLSAMFGKVPAFVHNSYYPLAVFVAVFMVRGEGLERCFEALKSGLVVLVLGSLVAAVVTPGMAIQTDYGGWVPGLKIRLWGLGSNANSIGPLALLLALLDYMHPYRRWALRLIVWLGTFAVLLLAQSKTVWLIMLLTIAFMVLYSGSRDGRREARMIFLVVLCAVAAALAIALLAIDPQRIVSKLAVTQVGTDLSTLTGRAAIWGVAWRTWQESFWFGYGPDAWGPLFRAHIGMEFAFHAHSQFMQTLSAAGIFGGLALFGYLAVMAMASVRAARASRGVSLCLALFIIARCFTEVPLDVDSLFIGETIIHLAWFMVVLIPFKRGKIGSEAIPRHSPSGAQASFA